MSDTPQFTVAMLDKPFMDAPFDISIEREVLKGVANVECYGVFQGGDIPGLSLLLHSTNIVLDKVAEADGFLAWHHITQIDEQIIKKMTKGKIIVRIGMGFDNVDLKAAAAHNIRVSNVPDYGVEEVADTTLCLLLNLLRKTHSLANLTKEGKWSAAEAKGALRVSGKTLGIVGLGRIGMAVALRAKAFSLNVKYYDPYIEFGRAKALGITQVLSLKELLEQCNIISIHCPLVHNNKSNRNLINTENIKYMQKGSFLINTARGGIVEEAALINALQDGTLAGVGIDVFDPEPYNGPLLKCPNVIATPHTAFYSDEGVVEMRTKAAMEVRRMLLGEPLLYCVNGQYFS